MFHTDEHFIIGADHIRDGEPCEDYAHSGTVRDMAFAVVSDGCSSGGFTDVGARLTCLAAVAALRNRIRLGDSALLPHELGLEQRVIMKSIQETLGLRAFDMQATCLGAYRTPAGGFIHARGDGAFATVSADGTIRAVRIEWPDSTPYYPAYLEENLDAFIAAHGGDVNAPVMAVTRWTKRLREEAEITDTRYTLQEGINGLVELIPADTLFVAVFSDGVAQCGLLWHEAVTRLLAYKSVAGSFAKRRMIRFSKEIRKTGGEPIDDIACAVIRASTDVEEGGSP